MTDAWIDPNQDYSVSWSYWPVSSPSHYAAVSGGDEATGVVTTTDNAVEEFGMTSVDDVSGNSVTQVIVYSSGSSIYTSTAEITIWDGTGYQTTQELNIYYGGPVRTYNTFSSLSMNQSNLDDLRVKYIADTTVVGGKGPGMILTDMHVIATYTPVPSGWGHKIYTISPDNIASVYGISRENIAKINQT